MADTKYTKNELTHLQSKLMQLMRYLPTLQLKKMLLQKEVNKAHEEVLHAHSLYKRERADAEPHILLLTDTHAHMLMQRTEMEHLDILYDNIAGIEIPQLEKVLFSEITTPMLMQPVWLDSAVLLVRSLQTAYQKILIAIKKRELLEEEHRVISVRVNLFEKRLIPEAERDINKIRVFLGDQDLQAVVQAKVSKNKIMQRRAGAVEA